MVQEGTGPYSCIPDLKSESELGHEGTQLAAEKGSASPKKEEEKKKNPTM